MSGKDTTVYRILEGLDALESKGRKATWYTLEKGVPLYLSADKNYIPVKAVLDRLIAEGFVSEKRVGKLPALSLTDVGKRLFQTLKTYAEESSMQATMVELVLPSMTNCHGTLFGGKALEMMDKAAAVVALRHARTNIVTAGMDSVSFEAPISESEIVEVVATLVQVGRSSMKVEVEVFGENPKTGEKRRCTKAQLTMVALDDEGKPTKVPALAMSDGFGC